MKAEREDLGLYEQVEAVMARLAAGERSAVWELHDLAEPSLGRMIRAEARRLDVRIVDEDVFDLTIDAAEELANLARSWRPGGALPWVWARMRVRSVVHDHIGVFADELDDSHLELVAIESAESIDVPRRVLRDLAQHHPAARVLDERLALVASERDADIWLRVRLEAATGNRAPAITVGADHDLRPEAVRKVVQRVNARLEEVA